jgi:Bacterial type II/III secretion system short domain
MSLFRFLSVAVGLTLVMGLLLSSATAQERSKETTRKMKTAPSLSRQVYTVRGGQAKELANVLALHFKSDSLFQVSPEARSNSLLLNGSKSSLDEALAVLREIDRPARTVHIQEFLIELSPKADSETGADRKPINPAELTGPVRDVDAKIRDLQKRALIARLQRIELTTEDGQGAQVRASASRPYTTAVNFSSGVGGPGFSGFRGRAGRGATGTAPPGASDGDASFSGGITSRSVAYREVGTSIHVEPEVGVGGLVRLALRVEDTRMRAAESVSLATDEKGKTVPATEFLISTLESKLSVRTGHVALAQGMATESKTRHAETIILISAVIEDAK